jgi:putative membrane protein
MRTTAVTLALLALAGTGVRAEEAQPLAGPDTQFLAEAIQDGMAEVDLGKTAEKKASSPEVKRFAEHMVKDHSAANKKLEALAKKHKIEANGTYGTPPLKPDEQAQGEKADLSKLSGKEFDQAYAKEMVQDHEKAVSLFQDEAKNGKDKEVSELASSMLPTLEEHLKMARALAK